MFIFLSLIRSKRTCSCRISGSIDCTGGERHSAVGSAYYPDSSELEGGYVDMRDHPLQTLQVKTNVYLHKNANMQKD